MVVNLILKLAAHVALSQLRPRLLLNAFTVSAALLEIINDDAIIATNLVLCARGTAIARPHFYHQTSRGKELWG